MKKAVFLFLLPALAEAAPVISSFNPPTAPTTGNIQVTINGTGLDDNDPPLGNEDPTVTVGGQMATIIGDPSPNQLTFLLPPGQGANVQVKVTLDGEQGSGFFSYQPPSINVGGVSGSSPTQGGGTFTITGSNFGLNGSVTVGTGAASITSWSHGSITAQAPAGQGTNLPVTVIAGGQSSGPTGQFSYQPPTIVGVTAAALPTAGGVPVTLNGTNFGTVATLDFNSVTIPVDSQTQNTLSFTLPPGEGFDIPVEVTVGGQTSPTFDFDYDPPTILGISPATGPSPVATEITLTGSNFGLSPTVIFGASAGVVVSSTHEEIVFTRPPGEVGSLEVVVSAAGQLSDHTHFLSTPLTSPPGYYIDTVNGQIVPAPPGRYAPNPDMTTAFDAPPGHYTPVPGMSQAIPASPGYYVNIIGSPEQFPAPAGTYTDAPGSLTPDPADAGHYTPVDGMRAQIPADPGFYVTNSGSDQQTPAPAGRYATGPMATIANLAEAGTYAPIEGMRDAIPAPAGTYASAAGLTSVLPVPPGFESTDGASLTPLPQIQIVGAEKLTSGDFELTFSTNTTDNYGIFYTEDLVNFTLIQTVPGTGADVQVAVTPPNPAATRRFWVVGPVQVPAN
ncbi:hypothetical protein HAHE_06950 [Haloferula helveola]|uniref:IPT/TIG domain-containing protein n=1 Tax=Haloferula helveola TaxID=490095 RepID=A0ABN6H1G8_9BACT|nr:hypothetical protein HAHE_06950 [Haloferula helveola]